jgi:single-stranded DNA-binding protein
VPADPRTSVSAVIEWHPTRARLGYVAKDRDRPSGRRLCRRGDAGIPAESATLKGVVMSGIEIALFGTLGRDAEPKTSKSGKPYLRLNVRVGDGDDVQWVSVMAFDEKAIAAADKMLKGARVYVEGRLSIGEWTGQDGVKRHGLSAMSWHCRLAQIGRNKQKRSISVAGGTSTTSRARHSEGEAQLNDEIPF